jgi:hypothetical protein
MRISVLTTTKYRPDFIGIECRLNVEVVHDGALHFIPMCRDVNRYSTFKKRDFTPFHV